MTYSNHCTLPAELLEQISEQGLDYLPELIRVIVNTAMQAERQQHLGASLYQHSAEGTGQANGFKPNTVKTRLGAINFAVPRSAGALFMAIHGSPEDGCGYLNYPVDLGEYWAHPREGCAWGGASPRQFPMSSKIRHCKLRTKKII